VPQNIQITQDTVKELVCIPQVTAGKNLRSQDYASQVVDCQVFQIVG